MLRDAPGVCNRLIDEHTATAMRRMPPTATNARSAWSDAPLRPGMIHQESFGHHDQARDNTTADTSVGSRH
ncbi:MAG TPA: hypothetical protein VMQ73_00125, partial [Methylomirabilota bacterium]|nr:hypothetical protein [Methylomirabilota bacterium]